LAGRVARGAGKDVWVDLSDIRKGADWHAKILAAVESARVLVPVLTPEFARSEPCAEEIDQAVGHNKRLVPIVRRPVDRGSLRAKLTTPNWIFFVDAREFSWLPRHAYLDEGSAEKEVRRVRRLLRRLHCRAAGASVGFSLHRRHGPWITWLGNRFL
jgi:hypothetical protein